jgi:hypothetical protein
MHIALMTHFNNLDVYALPSGKGTAIQILSLQNCDCKTTPKTMLKSKDDKYLYIAGLDQIVIYQIDSKALTLYKTLVLSSTCYELLDNGFIIAVLNTKANKSKNSVKMQSIAIIDPF